MEDQGGVAVVILLAVIVTCITVFMLNIGEPTGVLVGWLFPKV